MSVQAVPPRAVSTRWRGPRRRKVPSILQYEAVECGAASLAMILAGFGAWIPLEQLREACGVSRDGSKASNMLVAARKFGLKAKGFRKEVDKLADVPWPAIIHWNFNHYVVFEGFAKGRAWINDPASGPRSVSMQELDESFTGVVLVFERDAGFRTTRKPPGLLAALRSRMTGSRSGFVLIMLVSLALVVPGLIAPVFGKMFVDGILINDQERWAGPLIAGMLLTAFVRMLLTLLQANLLLKLQTKLAVVGAAQFIWHVIRLPMGFFTQRHAGEIASRVESNEGIARLLSGAVAGVVVNLVQAFFFGILLLCYDLLLGALVMMMQVPNYFLLRSMQARMKETASHIEATQGKLGASTIGTIQNIETIKASGLERQAFERWAGHHASALDAMRASAAHSLVLSLVPSLVGALSSGAVLGFGAWRVMNGALTIGDLVAFQSVAASFSGPISSFMGLGAQSVQAKVTLQRVEDALNNPVDPLVAAGQAQPLAETQAPLRGEVELAGVSFGYSRLAPPLLKDVDLKLAPGMRVAFVGGSGSGKSTLGRVVCGLFGAWSGDILFDGKRMDTISQEARARSIAYVDQDIFLFEGTVRDNLTLWDRSIPDQDLIQALADAAMLDDITIRPGQLDAHVEEGGRNFSGGQRQRLEMARAFVGNPSVLVLDEATAALDTSTEKIIDDNIRRRGCTCIIIAHRLSTIRDCDDIILFKQGRIVERGTHDYLMSLDGEYVNLIRST